MEDLLRLAHLAREKALREGAEQVEVHTYRGESVAVELEKGKVKTATAHQGGGVSLRCFYRGGKGTASTNSLTEAAVTQAATQAAAMSRAAAPDPDFVTLVSPAAYPEVGGLFDEAVAGMSAGEVMRCALDAVEEARAVYSEAVVNGGADRSWQEYALVNSPGVEATGRWCSVSVGAFVIVKRGDEVGSFFDYDVARVMADFQPAGVGTKAAEVAVQMLGARPVVTGIQPVIFGPLASGSLGGSLCWAANAESIQRKRSWAVGKRGERVASAVVSLRDEPLIPRGLGSAPFDGEGFPHRPLEVVREGVLLTYFHNSYTANKAHEPNTGHASNGGIAPTNIIPALGKKTAAEIIKETDSGIYVNMGGVSPNSVNGEISSVVDFGFKIERGELAYPVHNTMIAMNIVDLLKNVDAISSDYREEPGAIMPTVRVSAAQIVSAE
jgi:PmbA protein